MADSIHFKLTYKGETRRLALQRSNDQLMAEVKGRVATIVGSPIEDIELSWKDINSASISHPRFPLETPDDLRRAIEHITYFDGMCEKMKNRPPCLHLEVLVRKDKSIGDSAELPATEAVVPSAKPEAFDASAKPEVPVGKEESPDSVAKPEASAAKPVQPVDKTEVAAVKPVGTTRENEGATTNNETAKPAAAKSVKVPLRYCILCNKKMVLGQQFVTCLSTAAHIFCFDCTGKKIRQGETHCPTGQKCSGYSDGKGGPWEFTTSIIQIILGTEYEEYKKNCDEAAKYKEACAAAAARAAAAAAAKERANRKRAAEAAVVNAAYTRRKTADAAASVPTADAADIDNDALEEMERWLQTEVAAAKTAMQNAAVNAKSSIQNGAAAAKSGFTAAAAAAKLGLNEVSKIVEQINAKCDENQEKDEEKENSTKNEDGSEEETDCGVRGCGDCSKLKDRVSELERQLKSNVKIV